MSRPQGFLTFSCLGSEAGVGEDGGQRPSSARPGGTHSRAGPASAELAVSRAGRGEPGWSHLVTNLCLTAAAPTTRHLLQVLLCQY